MLVKKNHLNANKIQITTYVSNVTIINFLGKVFFIVICFTLINTSKGFSQSEIYWDSTYRPTIYSSLVQQFRAFPPTKTDIVFLGNSITFWGDWNERLKNLKIKNQGIPGDITFGLLDRISEAIKGKPLKVFILIGINDIAKHIPDSLILNNYKRIINQIQLGSPTTKIFFQTLLPTNASFNTMKGYYNKEKNILKINASLKKLACTNKFQLIDLYSHFVDSSGNLIKDYSWDGVHLTQKGYLEWVKILQAGHYL